MLPGLRFLFAAIILTMSVLVFGLGAAALLRAAHEEVASIPSRRAPPETIFAQPNDAARPVLAMLRIDPPAAEPKTLENIPAPLEPAAIPATPPEPERIAALKPDEPTPPATAKNEISVKETPAPGEAAQAATEAPAPADEIKIAATTEVAPMASEMAPASSEQARAQASPEPDLAVTKIATLGGPPVAIEPSAQAAGARADRSVVKKRAQARRAKERRRLAQRARLARQATTPAADPFGQPAATPRAR